MKSKIFTGLFKRNRGFRGITWLNIAGLALGLTGILLISFWIGHELSYDRFHKDHKRIYRVESLVKFGGEPVVWEVAPAPAAEALLRDFQEVTMSVAMQKGYNPVLKVGDQVFGEANLYYSTPSFFDMFSFRLAEGDRSRVLSDPYSVVISENVAKKFFGKEDPLGRSILLDNQQLLTIRGILKNTPSNSHLTIDYLVPFSLLAEKGKDLKKWGNIDYITYIKLAENVNPEQFNLKLGKYLAGKGSYEDVILFINPLDRIHLYHDPGFRDFHTGSGEKDPINRVILFGLIALMILLIACINFVNLATATATNRAKEIGVRKVAGAGRGDLMLVMFGESIVQTMISMIIAFLVVVLVTPFFERVTGIGIAGGEIFNLRNIIVSMILMIVTGLLAGTYPALVLSSFRPVKVLKPSVNNKLEGAGLRKVLVVAQFVLTIIFIFCIIVMNRQISYMQNRELGFRKERIMVFYPPVEAGGTEKSFAALLSDIKSIPGVENAAIGGNVPVNMGNFNTLDSWEGNNTGRKLKFHMMQVDDDYLNLLGIQIVSGREFRSGAIMDEVIINQTAAKQMEMVEPLGKWIFFNGRRFSIAGVVRDFYFRKLNEEIKPVIIYKDTEWWTRKIFIKLTPGSGNQTVIKISSTLKEFARDWPVNYKFLDEEVKGYYEDERSVSILIDTAAILSIIISSIGLFGFAAFTARRRQKEIGLRKVQGAGVAEVLTLLIREFIMLVLIASVIALPLGYWLSGMWLDGYAVRISIKPLYFILTIVLVASITIGTVAFHTIRTACLDPILVLKEE